MGRLRVSGRVSRRVAGPVAAGLLLAACTDAPAGGALAGGAPAVPPAAAPAADAKAATTPGFGASDLADFFDCVRVQDAVVIAAHRGGPGPGYPENAIETFAHTLATATPVLEIDIAESRDGVLFLFHDSTLGRLTHGEGYVSDTDWAEISALFLKDTEGRVTAFHPPLLRDALVWAKANGALLELDKKETTSYRNIIAAVREVGAENHVILITYSPAQAAEVARLAPDLMMTASAAGAADLRDLSGRGVDLTRLVAWTGTAEVRPDLWDALARNGVEPAFGTLGRAGERLDDDYGPRDYQALVEDGVRLIATDRPGEVAGFLDADDRARTVCLK